MYIDFYVNTLYKYLSCNTKNTTSSRSMNEHHKFSKSLCFFRTHWITCMVTGVPISTPQTSDDRIANQGESLPTGHSGSGHEHRAGVINMTIFWCARYPTI